jgi:enamine deaminase RidA (YjgF/YER057c/UK114 family)
VVVAGAGRTVYLAGQTAQGKDGRVDGATVADQFDAAAANTVTALRAAGASPEHLVSIQIFTTDLQQYRSSLEQIGRVYRNHFGRHYPAISLFEVSSLFDRAATIELVCVAVIPD